VFFNVLYLGPLAMILRSAARDDRLLWLGLWFFCLANWVGQDYLSPQGLNFFFYLVVLAILLRWFGLATAFAHPASRWLHRLGPLSFAARWLTGWLAAADVPARPSRPWQRVGLIGVVVVLLAVSVSSHQLTPFFLLAALTALVAADRVTPRGLPVLLAVMIGAWFSFMAAPYVSGHLSGLVGEFGRVAEIADANVAARLQGSAEHLVVVRMRVVMSLALWGLAVVGAVGRVRRGHRDLTMVLLGATPFSLLALQAYGGEMAIRVYLFALPPVLFFAGSLLYPAPTVRPSGRQAAAVALMSLALLVGFLVARYGNERMDHFTRQEVDAVDRLYAIAEPGSALIAGHWNSPWMFRGYETYLYTDLDSLGKTIIPNADVSALLHRAKELEEKRNRPVYLILTRSQEAAIDLMQGSAPGSLDRVEQAVLASGGFRVVFHNEDATILVLARTEERR
jgi:hypothetical protein